MSSALIARPESRSPAPVKLSWQRLELWFATNLPEVRESLRPPATPSDLQAFEQSTRYELPDDVKESFLIHDGQIEGTGALLGQPIDSLLAIRRRCKQIRSTYEKFGTSDWT